MAWLLLAWGIARALGFFVFVYTGEAVRLFGEFGKSGTVLAGAVGRWLSWAHWTAMIPATLITPGLAVCALFGWIAVRRAACIAAVAMVICCLADATFYASWRVVRPVTWVSLDVPCGIVDAATPALVPVLLVYSLRRRSADISDRLWWGRVTRMLVLWSGAFVLASKINGYALWFVRGWPALADVPTFLAYAQMVWPIPLVVSAASLLACSRLRRMALWCIGLSAAIAAVTEAYYCAALLQGYVGRATRVAIVADAFASRIQVPLLVCALLVSWWPVLSGLASTLLCDTRPMCAQCGYNLTGNVSGRCPECGGQL